MAKKLNKGLAALRKERPDVKLQTWVLKQVV